MVLYRWIVLLHVLSACGFFLSHGASALTMFKLRGERSPERICALLELSHMGVVPMIATLLGLLVSGIAAGFMAGWWRYGWIWAALVLLVAVDLVMGRLGRAYLERVGRALGMVNPKEVKKGIVLPRVASPVELERILTSGHPRLLASIGLSGLAAIVLLMMFKPF